MFKIKKLFCCILLCAILIPINQVMALETIEIPIIMYHKVSTNSALWGKFTISPGEFESDLKYLKDRGYETVTMTDLIGFVHDGTPLPEKPIVLSFDDGTYSDYLYVFPLLQEYEMKAVVSIIGVITDEYSAEGRTDIRYPHLIWSQIQEMVASGYVEIQNHGYNLHSGCGAGKMRGESEREYKLRLEKDLILLQDRVFEETGTRPNTFTYPYGNYCSQAEDVLHKLGFSASLVCEERNNLLQAGDPESLFRLGRILRSHGKSSDVIFGNHGIM